MLLSHLLFCLGWTLYCVLHSALASTRVKTFIQPLMRNYSAYYRSVYSFIAIGGLVALITWEYFMPTPKLWENNTFHLSVGIIVSLGGFCMMMFCLKKYFVSHRGYKELLTENIQPVFVSKGMNRWVRHPLYLSTFIFVWGLLPVFPYLSFLIVNIVITVYTLIGIRFEEQKLIKTFGQAYRDYIKDVPKIIPGMRIGSQ